MGKPGFPPRRWYIHGYGSMESSVTGIGLVTIDTRVKPLIDRLFRVPAYRSDFNGCWTKKA
jgi:hypothetical protein